MLFLTRNIPPVCHPNFNSVRQPTEYWANNMYRAILLMPKAMFPQWYDEVIHAQNIQSHFRVDVTNLPNIF